MSDFVAKVKQKLSVVTGKGYKPIRITCNKKAYKILKSAGLNIYIDFDRFMVDFSTWQQKSIPEAYVWVAGIIDYHPFFDVA